MNKHTGLMVLGAGLAIQGVDYFTTPANLRGTPAGGGIFYGTGGFLSSVPWVGFALILGGGAMWLMAGRK